ncbi:MAG: diacylglycerol kinase family lipid kinase [Rikenellaceae bacterium]
MGEVDIQAWLVIVNPQAGSGRGLEEYPQISRLLRDENIKYEPLFTEHKFHAVELTVTAIKQGYRKLLIVGGDGTIHEVINGLFIQQCVEPKEVTIGVIAVGSVNNWARSAGVPIRIDKAIKVIKRGYTYLQDVGVVSYEESHYSQTRYFANAAGMGFNTFALKRLKHIHNKGRTGRVRQIANFIRSFFKYKPTGIKVWIDDKLVWNDLLMSLAIGIGSYNVGGMKQLPNAVVDDGELDLSLFRPIHFWHIMFRTHYLFDGGIYRIGHILQQRGAKIRVESTPEISLEVDGELLGESPFEFSVMQKAIKVIAHNKRAATLSARRGK